MAPDTHCTVRTGTHEPRLRRNPPDLQHAYVVPECVSTEDFERYNERVRKEVTVHTCMEYVHGTVVGAGCEERECWVESDRADCARVIPMYGKMDSERGRGEK